MHALRYLSAGLLLGAPIAGAQTAANHIALGDKEYVAMHAPAALQHYEAAIKEDPKNYEALWKASRSAVDLGSYERDDDKRANYFKNAELYARRAVEANPGDAEGHFNRRPRTPKPTKSICAVATRWAVTSITRSRASTSIRLSNISNVPLISILRLPWPTARWAPRTRVAS